jgi:hypothetical protein
MKTTMVVKKQEEKGELEKTNNRHIKGTFQPVGQ